MNNEFNYPHNNQAEIAILGLILTEPLAIKLLIEKGVNEDYFYNIKHKEIFKESKLVYEKHNSVDVQILLAELSVDPKGLSNVGGVDYLIELVENGSTKSSMDFYVNILSDNYRLREVIKTSQETIQKAISNEDNVDDLFIELEDEIRNISKGTNNIELKSMQQVMKETMEKFHHAIENDGELTGLDTGYRQLNYLTNGLQDGDFIIIGARPSVGKSAFALNIALNVAERNKNGSANVAFFSMEMPDTQLSSRLLSTVSGVNNYKIKSGSVNQQEYNDVSSASNKLSNLNLFINDKGGSTIGDISQYVRKIKEEKGLDLIIIDYLQLINSSGNRENRQQEISKISRQLKQVALELKVPIIALSQLSRGIETRENKEPMLSDLRESGSIEQDKIKKSLIML